MTKQTANNQASLASITKKLFKVFSKTLNCGVTLLDVTVDVAADAVDLTSSAARAIPETARQTAKLPSYAKTKYISESRAISTEEAQAIVDEESWGSVEDVFKSVGNVMGTAANATKKAFTEE